MIRASHQDSIPELRIDLHCDADSIEVGERVTLRVVRSYPSAFRIDDLATQSLDPLRTRLRARKREERDGRVVETLTYDAWLFDVPALPESANASDDMRIEVPPLELRATPRKGGAVLVAKSAALVLRVRPTVAEGPIEKPDPPPSKGTSIRAWALSATALACALGFVVLWRRRRLALDQRRLDADASLREALQSDAASFATLSSALREAMHRHAGIDAVHQAASKALASEAATERLGPELAARCLAVLANLEERCYAKSQASNADERALRALVRATFEDVVARSKAQRLEPQLGRQA